MSHFEDVPALVAVEGEEVAIGRGEIWLPTEDSLGNWNVVVPGLVSAFFNAKPARVAFVIGGREVLGGDAIATSTTKDLDGGIQTTFIGNGPLE